MRESFMLADKMPTCGNCAKYCPTKALTLVEEKDKKKISTP
ncbi:MAG TPA: hypothetical protein P5527_00405 [Kiritimatiellia bacterium]|nr:hypothetical protein [Kiritimatiellia bacterium]